MKSIKIIFTDNKSVVIESLNIDFAMNGVMIYITDSENNVKGFRSSLVKSIELIS